MHNIHSFENYGTKINLAKHCEDNDLIFNTFILLIFMKTPKTVLLFLIILSTFSCNPKVNKEILPAPEISINKIWIDGTAYEPTDTIQLENASEVKIDYSVSSSAPLRFVSDYYVYGTTGSLIKTHPSAEISNPTNFTTQFLCNDFMPFRCGFRILAVDNFGGSISKGFYLKLPATGLTDINTGDPLFNHNNRSFGPSQKDGNSVDLGKTFNSCKANGRYVQFDYAYASSTTNSADRARSLDFGANFLNGKPILFSPFSFNALYPDKLATERFFTDVTRDDLSKTKFLHLGRFTTSMWNSLTLNDQLTYLANSFNPTDDKIEIEPANFYFFKSSSASYNWYGVIYVTSIITTAGAERINLNVKCFKYW